MSLSGPHGLVTALHMCGASEEAVEIARGLIAAGLVRWSDGFYVVTSAAHYPLIVPDHTRKGLPASPAEEDWPRGMGLALSPLSSSRAHLDDVAAFGAEEGYVEKPTIACSHPKQDCPCPNRCSRVGVCAADLVAAP